MKDEEPIAEHQIRENRTQRHNCDTTDITAFWLKIINKNRNTYFVELYRFGFHKSKYKNLNNLPFKRFQSEIETKLA